MFWNFCDVTKRKLGKHQDFDTIENYKELIKQYQSIIENVKEIVYQADLEGKWTFLNPSWTDITGFQIEESLGVPFTNFVHPDEQERIMEVFNSIILNREDIFKLEVPYVSKNGKTIWFEAFAIITYDAHGAAIGTTGTLFDITDRKNHERTMIHNEQLYKSIFQYNHTPSYMMDVDGNFTHVNDAIEEITGFKREDLIGAPYVPFVTPSYVESTNMYFQRVINGESLTFESEIVQKQGTLVYLQVNLTPIIIDGEITGAVGIAFDKTKEKRSERQLLESENRYRSLIHLSPEAIFVHSPQQIELVNDKLVEFFGVKGKEDLLGKTVFDFLHPDDAQMVTENMELGFKDASFLNHRDELRFIRLDGNVVTAKVSASLIEYSGSMAIMGVLYDITEKKEVDRKLLEAHELLIKLSNLDGLTGIPNRRSYNEQIQKDWELALKNNETLSLLMIDIDCFKLYNDAYGHLQGDTCLKAVATSIQDYLNPTGEFVARYGGEEFTVILRNASSERILEVANSLRSNIEALQIPHAQSTIGPHVTISVGVATGSPSSGQSLHDLMQYADRALYESKRGGRNTVQFY